MSSCVLRIDNSKTFEPVCSANKIFLCKVGLSMHSYVFGECIDNPPLSINPLVSEYSGSKVDSISFKTTFDFMFLEGRCPRIHPDVLQLWPTLLVSNKILWTFIFKNKAAQTVICRFPRFLSPTRPKVLSSASSSVSYTHLTLPTKA